MPFPDWSPAFRGALEQMALATRRPARGRRTGDVRSAARGRALEFADYRPYASGDDPKLVDWRAYARLGRLYLKQFEEERARRLTLLVDASASLDWGDGPTHKGRYARELAAALAWIALSRGEPVDGYLLRDGRAEPLPGATSRSGAAALLRRLGEVVERGATDLGPAIAAARPAAAEGPVVLISDLLEPGWPAALEALAASREGTVLQVLAPAEWDPPLGDEVELEDAETGELRATRLGPVELAAYRSRLDALLADVRASCARLGLLYAPVSSGAPLPGTVLRDLPAAGLLA
jgi:uncharacterized protein (DUF58 family)